MTTLRRLAAVLLLSWAGICAAADWRLTPEASQLEFIATYEGQPVLGAFRRFDVRLAFDPRQPSGSRLEVSVATGSADMNSDDVTQTIKGPEWFDAGRYPEARFTSTDIVQEGPGRYAARGTLSLKGVQRRLTVPITWNESGDTANMRGQLTIRRTDFNIGTGEWASGSMIGLDVVLRFNVKVRKAG
jgi:polyisoprenoid-binding protein YceI